MRPIAQRLIQLDPQTAQIVMIAAETDLGDMLRRHALQIAQLIVKAADIHALATIRGLRLAGEPAAIVKDVHAGLGIPCAVQHRYPPLRERDPGGEAPPLPASGCASRCR